MTKQAAFEKISNAAFIFEIKRSVGGIINTPLLSAAGGGHG